MSGVCAATKGWILSNIVQHRLIARRSKRSAGLFFLWLHAENIDRLRGRAGRGKFGTGKSAAFGIGVSLEIDTRRDNMRNVARLTRESIDNSHGEEIPVDWLVRNEHTSLPNGAHVKIGGIALSRINTQAIIEYLERHLQVFWARLPEVAVNEHVCQYKEPVVEEVFNFEASAGQSKVLGEVKLTIKVSPTPLPQAETGVAVIAGPGNLVDCNARIRSDAMGGSRWTHFTGSAFEPLEHDE
jgi:hypothetical protein